MIPRYTRPEMAKIFEAENRFKIWLEIETLACEKMADLGIIPASVPKALRDKAKFDVARIDEIEREVRHDVIAFLTNIGEHIGDDARFVHQGMTSSDVIDTAFAVQLTQAADLLLQDLDKLLAALRKRAAGHGATRGIGRRPRIHSAPTTL
ncbi:MAG TPA: adenylosuccinate lyase, partial [Rhodospirillaceae bacterium]|nr:adenylosuccinate lyase [Rhodospirillaceae bacterium]